MCIEEKFVERNPGVWQEERSANKVVGHPVSVTRILRVFARRSQGVNYHRHARARAREYVSTRAP